VQNIQSVVFVYDWILYGSDCEQLHRHSVAKQCSIPSSYTWYKQTHLNSEGESLKGSFAQQYSLMKKCPRSRGRPKRTRTEVVKEDSLARKLNKEDAMDSSKWRKLIKGVRSGWVWVGEFLLVPAYLGSPWPKAVKRLCVVCVCVWRNALYFSVHDSLQNYSSHICRHPRIMGTDLQLTFCKLLHYICFYNVSSQQNISACAKLQTFSVMSLVYSFK